MEKITKDAFCVIGKAGSTKDGEGFVRKLWNEANSHFVEVAQLAAKNADGSLKGIWGAMTDFSFEFKPWENNFSEGMYLAGVEAEISAVAPTGWKKWIIPGFEYLKIPVQAPDTFEKTIKYLKENNIPLAGAVQDFTEPKTGENFMLFPVACNDSKRKLIQDLKSATNQFSVCGLHCEYCFLSEWCAGCKSACNMCSYATLSDDNTCPNVACCKEKGFDGCYQCGKIRGCQTGFYSPDSDGANASKALTILRRDYGDKAVTAALAKMHEKYDFLKLQEVLNADIDKAVEQLKTFAETGAQQAFIIKGNAE